MRAITSSGVALSGLRKSYGPIQAVRGVDISIDAGETVALLGPNGAGKSTTIDMLLGLARPDAGTVSVFGLPPGEAVRAGEVGGMLQTGSLISDMSVRELIEMVASLYPHPLEVDDALDVGGCGGFASQRTNKLSGGQTQRVRFAVAIVANPELFVLDEPTASLDVEGRREFWQCVRGFAARGKTVLFATHYLEEADLYSDRIVLMARGLVVADGPTTEIKARVGTRTIRATLPPEGQRHADGGPDGGRTALEQLPGVTEVQDRGEAVILRCSDSDAALRALLKGWPAARDIEVSGASLEDAFVALTGDNFEGDKIVDETLSSTSEGGQ